MCLCYRHYVSRSIYLFGENLAGTFAFLAVWMHAPLVETGNFVCSGNSTADYSPRKLLTVSVKHWYPSFFSHVCGVYVFILLWCVATRVCVNV